MRLKSVVVKNFCQHEERKDSFCPGVVGIMGPNGSGKSNYLGAIRYAFTGSSDNAGVKADDLKWGAEKGSVAVEFVSGSVEGAIKRDIKSTRCSLKFGEREYKTAAELDQAVYGILGITPKVLTELVFVSQGQTEGILFQKSADRAKSLQVLFGTESAEHIRELLMEEASRTPAESKAEAIAQLESQLKANVEEPLDKLKAAYAELSKGLFSLEQKEKLLDLVAEFENYTRHEVVFKAEKEKTEGLLKQIAESETVFKTSTNLVSTLRSILQSTEKEAAAARLRIENYSMAKWACDTRRLSQKTVEECRTKLLTRGPLAPLDPTELEKRKQAYADLKAELDISDRIAAVDAETGVCPACGQVLNASHLQTHAKKAAVLAPKAAVLKTSLQGDELKYSTFLSALCVHESDQRNTKASLDSHLSTLNSTPVVAEPTAVQQAEDKEITALFNSTCKSLEEAQARASMIQAAFERTKTLYEESRARMAGEEVAMGACSIPAGRCVEIRLELAGNRALELKASEAAGAIKNLESQRLNLLSKINELKAADAANKRRLEWKAFVEKARLLLHRDNLPRLVAQRYLGSLNTKLAQYLEIFEVPFASHIDGELNINCVFGGNRTVNASRLSGGQKVMLGIAFRFAVHELFAADLGLMILDEPTAYLDDDHLDCVFELLEKVKNYSRTSGLQLIVVTHEQRLMGVFDSVIRF